ncbi:hypothetical protein Tco_0786760 [Tanacetum coccineum]
MASATSSPYQDRSEKLLLAPRPIRTSDSFESTRRCRRGLLILYRFYFAGIHMYTILINNVTKKVHLLQPELTLGELGIRLLLPYPIPTPNTKMNFMVLLRLRVDQDVIDEHDNKLI